MQDDRQAREDISAAHIREVWGPVHISINERTREDWRKLPEPVAPAPVPAPSEDQPQHPVLDEGLEQHA